VLLSGTTVAALCGFAFLAGFTDSVGGGGGLIQVPALLLLLPGAPIPVLFGTNKLASSMGTVAAVGRYARGLEMDWRIIIPAAVASAGCSLLGAHTVSAIRPATLRPVILVLLAAVALFTWRARDFGTVHAPRLAGGVALAAAVATGGVLGFYDGFFGPGAGSFFIFVFVGVFGFDFLAASAAGKVLNLGSNAAAAIYFMATGQVLYLAAIPMGLASVAGATLGSHLALTRGVRLIRTFFLVVVSVLIAKLAWDTFRAP
jgi:uncharacterized membrane protein YfcA